MLYVVTYATESGDRGFVGVFEADKAPNEMQLLSIVEEQYPDEIYEGYSYMHLKCHRWDGKFQTFPAESTTGVQLL